MSAVASFIGGSISIVLVMFFAPLLASFALRFGPSEFFSMMLLALLSAAGLARGSFLKGLGMVLLGLIVGTVGIDVNSGLRRLTFGIWNLADGVNFAIVAMGFFAIAEVIASLETQHNTVLVAAKFAWRDLVPSPKVIRQTFGSIIRGAGLGALFGALPGSGPTVATFVSYSVEKRIARDPSRFGAGAIEGVTSPESANNAAAIAAYIPTLTLGVPGDAIMALVLGALMLFGITPGPGVITEHADLFWGLIASMWIGNVLLIILNIPFISVWVRVLSIPYNVLYPSIILFICIGVFSTKNDAFDIVILTVCGASGYVLGKLDCPAAPLLLAVILGPLIEENMRRALIISGGDPIVFVTHPISLLFLVLAALIVIGFAMAGLKQWNGGAQRETTPS